MIQRGALNATSLNPSHPSISLYPFIRLMGLARHSRTNCTSLQQQQAGLKTPGSGGTTLSTEEEDEDEEEGGDPAETLPSANSSRIVTTTGLLGAGEYVSTVFLAPTHACLQKRIRCWPVGDSI